MDTTSTQQPSGEDILVVIEAESGEQVALPISALPSDFVPGDNGQVIMVDEQAHEIVVESTEEEPVQQATPNHIPKTYSKSGIRSYAPTCGTTRIYHQLQPPTEQQPSPQSTQQQNQEQQRDQEQQQVEQHQQTPRQTEPPKEPRQKQKRKDTLTLRPINDEKLHFEIIEETILDNPEVKRKPRREYKTKKRARLALERKEQSPAPTSQSTNPPTSPIKDKEEPIQQLTPQSERRTRLSNQCRVATGKSYRCQDCDFSTDRINNIILHLKDSCPKRRI